MNKLLFGSIQTIPLLVLMVVSSVVSAQSVKTYIPPQAFTHKETIKFELDRLFPDIPFYNYVPALIEHESCLGLKHSRCWRSTSELKSQREQGVGLSMVTRTFNPDGSIRFDSLKGMRDMYMSELKEANWDTIKQRPDLQIRMMILHLRTDYKALYFVQDPIARLHMTDASYNGGRGGLLKERRACGLAKGCDPGIWFDNIENYCLKSKRILYANRNACDINRHHVKDVFFNRLPKYEAQYLTDL